MNTVPPVVYLLHGEDGHAQGEFVKTLVARLGDNATMNTTRLAGASLNLDELRGAAAAMPFLAPRRLVIVTEPLNRLRAQADQEKFIHVLENLPTTTALVIQVGKKLAAGHWLQKWAGKSGGRAFVKVCELPKGGGLVRWIQTKTQEKGGEITTQAAARLAELTGQNLPFADQEIEKLLAYVNYTRPIEVEDIESVVAFAKLEGNYFVLTDSLGTGDGRRAMQMLGRLLDERDPLQLLRGLATHFCKLIAVKEAVEEGHRPSELASLLDMNSYYAGKLAAQARNFDLSTLEGILRAFLDADERIKTGEMESQLTLETLVAGLTN